MVAFGVKKKQKVAIQGMDMDNKEADVAIESVDDSKQQRGVNDSMADTNDDDDSSSAVSVSSNNKSQRKASKKTSKKNRKKIRKK